MGWSMPVKWGYYDSTKKEVRIPPALGDPNKKVSIDTLDLYFQDYKSKIIKLLLKPSLADRIILSTNGQICIKVERTMVSAPTAMVQGFASIFGALAGGSSPLKDVVEVAKFGIEKAFDIGTEVTEREMAPKPSKAAGFIDQAFGQEIAVTVSAQHHEIKETKWFVVLPMQEITFKALSLVVQTCAG
jgi:hypothetical protein